MIEAALGAHAVRLQNVIEPALVFREAAAIVFRVPQMKHRRGEAAVLVFDAGVQQAASANMAATRFMEKLLMCMGSKNENVRRACCRRGAGHGIQRAQYDTPSLGTQHPG